jgi:hypothetical protein
MLVNFTEPSHYGGLMDSEALILASITQTDNYNFP